MDAFVLVTETPVTAHCWCRWSSRRWLGLVLRYRMLRARIRGPAEPPISPRAPTFTLHLHRCAALRTAAVRRRACERLRS